MGLRGDPSSADTLTALKYRGLQPGDYVPASNKVVNGSADMRLSAIVSSPAECHGHSFTCGNSVVAKQSGKGRCILPQKPVEKTEIECVLAECDHKGEVCRCGLDLVQMEHPTQPGVFLMACAPCNSIVGVSNKGSDAQQQCSTCQRWRKIVGVKVVQKRNADSVWIGPHSLPVTKLTGSNNNLQYARNIKGGYYITMYITANKQEEKDNIALALQGAYIAMNRTEQAEKLAQTQQEKGLPFTQPATGFTQGVRMMNAAWRKGTSKVNVGANKAAFLTLGEPVYRRSHPMATLSFGSVMAFLLGFMLTSCLGSFRTRSVPFVLDYAYRNSEHETLSLYEYRELGESVRSHKKHDEADEKDDGPPPQEQDDDREEADQGERSSESESEPDLDLTAGPIPVWRAEAPGEDHKAQEQDDLDSDSEVEESGALVVYKRGDAQRNANDDMRPPEEKAAKSKKQSFQFESGHPRATTCYFRPFQQPRIVRVLAPRMPNQKVMEDKLDGLVLTAQAKGELIRKQCLYAKMALTFTVPWRTVESLFSKETFPHLDGLPQDNSEDWCIAWKLACTQNRVTVVGKEWLRCQQEAHIDDFFDAAGFQEPDSEEGEASDEAFRVHPHLVFLASG